jgi:hypothetical protein
VRKTDALSSFLSSSIAQATTFPQPLPLPLRSLSLFSSLPPQKNPDARRRAVRDIERDLSEAEAVLSRMELEARSAAPTSAARGRALGAKVASYRADAAALARRAREAAAAAAASSTTTSSNAGDLARAELGLGGGATTSGGGRGGGGGGGGGGGFGAGSSNDRDRVLAAGERIERSGERIAQGRAQLLQTEVR